MSSGTGGRLRETETGEVADDDGVDGEESSSGESGSAGASSKVGGRMRGGGLRGAMIVGEYESGGSAFSGTTKVVFWLGFISIAAWAIYTDDTDTA
jgi:hypothetical protein